MEGLRLPIFYAVVVCKAGMLQIHSGSLKGRKLMVPKGAFVRPTTARVKQSVFDSLSDFRGKKVLDCFAGSGALGIESISRGASECIFIERETGVVRTLKKNLHTCGITSGYEIMNLDYKKALNILERNNKLFNYIFIDPPFELYKRLDAEILINSFIKLMDKDGIIVIEHTKQLDPFPDEISVMVKKYGSNYVSFVSHRI